MTTPLRPVPDSVGRWITRRRRLRWSDALLAWVLVWIPSVVVLGPERPEASAVAALILVGLGAAWPPVRARWRPVTAWVGLRISRGLRPGDRAWYLGPRDARLVVVTARRGIRLVIVRPDLQDESISVRRTRVFLLAAEGP